ncbi:MAG TPA: hypothetical protein VFT45_17305 [Longimicrobium sp.]|nr:hypothetical protein [Longimicrobium sp.]
MKNLLALFAAALLASPAAAQTSRPVQVGDFWLELSVDPMTDRPGGILLVEATESTTFQPVTFGWVCTENGLEVAFSPGRYMGREGATVQVRFDQNEPTAPFPWMPGNDPRYVFVPQEYIADFTDRALEATRLVVRAWDGMDNVYTYTFSMQGLTRGLRRLPCAGWVFEEG